MLLDKTNEDKIKLWIDTDTSNLRAEIDHPTFSGDTDHALKVPSVKVFVDDEYHSLPSKVLALHSIYNDPNFFSGMELSANEDSADSVAINDEQWEKDSSNNSIINLFSTPLFRNNFIQCLSLKPSGVRVVFRVSSSGGNLSNYTTENLPIASGEKGAYVDITDYGDSTESGNMQGGEGKILELLTPEGGSYIRQYKNLADLPSLFNSVYVGSGWAGVYQLEIDCNVSAGEFSTVYAFALNGLLMPMVTSTGTVAPFLEEFYTQINPLTNNSGDYLSWTHNGDAIKTSSDYDTWKANFSGFTPPPPCGDLVHWANSDNVTEHGDEDTSMFVAKISTISSNTEANTPALNYGIGVFGQAMIHMFAENYVNDTSSYESVWMESKINLKKIETATVFDLEKPLEAEYYGDVIGRVSTPTTQNIISDLMVNEFGIDNVAVSPDTDYDVLKYAFTVHEKINSKKLIEQLASASPFVLRFSNTGTFKFDSIPMSGGNVGDNQGNVTDNHTINPENVISFSYSRTNIDNLYTKIEFHYN